MAGMIYFSKHSWDASSWLVFYVMEHLASQIDDPTTKMEILERVENNLPTLDLRDPEKAPLVEIIVEDLPKHMPVLKDQTYQADLVALINELVDYAKEQQAQNDSRN